MRILVITALLFATSAADAQQRRSAGPPPEPRETIVGLPRYPLVGTWHGQMRLRLDTVPVSVDINRAGDKYTSVSFGPGGGRMNHLSTDYENGTLRWQIRNSGAGVWVYEAKRVVGDTIFGTVALKDGPGRDGQTEGGTLVLVRQRR